MVLLIALFLLLSGIVVGCGDAVVAPIEIGNPPVITGVQATYPPGEPHVVLQWDDLQPQRKQGVLYYLLFKTSSVDKFGNPVDFVGDTLDPISTDSVMIHNVIGVENSVYYYYMIAVSRFKGELVYGEPSNIDSAFVSSGISFSINRGQLFTIDSLCTLVIKDAFNQIQSFKLTDSVIADTAGNTEAFFNLASHPGNSSNISRTFTDNDIDSVLMVKPWVLKQGSGAKYAALQVTLKSGAVKTFVDDIAIEPYRIEIKMRNETEGSDRSMIVRPYEEELAAKRKGDKKVKTVVVGRPWVRFSVQNFGDATILEDFDYWLAVPDTSQLMKNGSGFWLETQPVSAKLTGNGRFHDDRHVYSYVFHPDSQQSLQTISTLNRVVPRVYGGVSDAQRSIPGSYWGPGLQSPVAIPDSVTNKVLYNYKLLTKLKNEALKLSNETQGYKSFAVVLRFKGRYFGDVRTVITNPDIADNGHIFTLFDFYPPMTKIDAFEFAVPKDGSIIDGVFNYSTNENGEGPIPVTKTSVLRGYCKDESLAEIVGIQLVIAEKPQSLAWTPTTHSTITYEYLRSLRHKTFPYEITVPATTFWPVKWTNIDMSGFNNGQYIVAIITEDEFGNKGISPMNPNGSGRTNPICYTILTGTMEL